MSTQTISDLPGPSGVPLLGNVLQFKPTELPTVLEKWADEYGSVFRFRIGTRNVVVVSAPDAVRQALKERPKNFRRMKQVEAVLEEMKTHGVFSAEGDSWKIQRKLMLPVFSPRPLQAAYPKFRIMAERLKQRWLDSTGPVDVLADLTRFTVDATSQLTFGEDVNSIEHGSGALQKNIEILFEGINRRVSAPFPYWKYIKLSADRNVERAIKEVEAEIIPMIQKARTAVEAGESTVAGTFLEAMILARDDDDPKRHLSDKEIYANVITLMLAGEDTTANMVAWMFYLLGRHPAVMAKLQAEADRVLGDESTLPRFEQSADLTYLAATAHESLRVKSPVPFIYLETLERCELGGVDLPAETAVIVLTRAVEHMEDTFEDPKAFKPERWLSDGGLKNEHKRILAFGSGPRICPGRPLALLESTLIVSMVAKNFDITVEDSDGVEEEFNFVLKPTNLRVRFQPRS